MFEDKIVLKNTRYMEGKPRVNVVTFKQLQDGSLMIFMENGKSKETGQKRTASILLDKSNTEALQDWLAKIES